MKDSATVHSPATHTTALVASVLLSALFPAPDAIAEEKIKNGNFENLDCIIGSSVGCPDWDMTGNAAVHGDGRDGKGATVGGLGPGAGTVTQKRLNLAVGNYAFSFSYRPAGTNLFGETAAIVKIGKRTVFAEMLRTIGTGQASYKKYQVFLMIYERDKGEQDVQFFAEESPNFAGPLFQIDDVSLVGP
ncbi:hypothetical protein [Sinorhizobium meliloti]|uniref:hypothetical protein n=1 Tax=Rhizobium meliloti TaxID=382 RepID=UPI000FD85938|nr:hypothetical protein [Sinorhizobium meliloti]RVG20314.1 hypothetical protein CN231_05760 [Sinorhizobium meliloti]